MSVDCANSCVQMQIAGIIIGHVVRGVIQDDPEALLFYFVALALVNVMRTRDSSNYSHNGVPHAHDLSVNK